MGRRTGAVNGAKAQIGFDLIGLAEMRNTDQNPGVVIFSPSPFLFTKSSLCPALLLYLVIHDLRTLRLQTRSTAHRREIRSIARLKKDSLTATQSRRFSSTPR